MDLSPDQHQVALGFENGVVHFLDAEGKLVWEAEVGQPVKSVKILARKKKVAILNEYSQLFLVDYSGKLAGPWGWKDSKVAWELPLTLENRESAKNFIQCIHDRGIVKAMEKESEY